jgi:hypothetical protein
MAGPMGVFTYTSDDTNAYKVRIDASNGAVTNTGFTGTTGRVTLPHGYRMRHVWVVDDSDVSGGRTPTGARRKLYCGTTTATVWTGADVSVDLPDFSVTPSVTVAWNVESYVGEQRFNR